MELRAQFRTIWTPEMDRYFIDLMLEQVGKENRRVDHLFSKNTWMHMMVMFNAKFNSKYEQDVLKNRHKMLRNLYRAVKNLLDQKGFRWDESRQMVTADNELWDDYLQTHPDARSYRVKTIPYYTDLIKIYGITDFGAKVVCTSVDDRKLSSNVSKHSPNTSNNTNYTADSLHDIMIDEDHSTSVSKNMVDFGSGRARTYWEPPMDRYFVRLTLEQVKKGNHIDGLLRKQAWGEMILLFNAKFGSNYGVDILKNRYKTLRRQHNLIMNLLKLDGFAWDDVCRMVVADDHVWQNYIKTHTDARQYMTRPIPYLKDLCLIFRELNNDDSKFVTVDQSPSPSPSPSASRYSQRASDSDSNTRATERGLDTPAAGVVIVNQSPSPSPSASRYSQRSSDSDSNTRSTKRGLDTPPAPDSLKKARGDNEGIATAVSSFAIERVVAAVQDLPDMDEELVLDACDLLEDETKAKTFMALDFKLRRKWLMRKLRPSQ